MKKIYSNPTIIMVRLEANRFCDFSVTLNRDVNIDNSDEFGARKGRYFEDDEEDDEEYY